MTAYVVPYQLKTCSAPVAGSSGGAEVDRGRGGSLGKVGGGVCPGLLRGLKHALGQPPASPPASPWPVSALGQPQTHTGRQTFQKINCFQVFHMVSQGLREVSDSKARASIKPNMLMLFSHLKKRFQDQSILVANKVCQSQNAYFLKPEKMVMTIWPNLLDLN